MTELAVFIDKDASLVRFDQIARELSRAGVEVAAKVPSVGVIIARCADTTTAIPTIRRIRDVTAVRQRMPA
jgi:hypothetical protein